MPQKTWVVGEEVLAADFNTFVQKQVVATFPNAAGRTAALPSPSEGMLTYLEDTNEYHTWNGTAWAAMKLAVAASTGAAVFPAILRTSTVVASTDGSGNIATPVGPLGNVSSIIVVPGDKQTPFIPAPYRAQFTPGATTVTWFMGSPSGTPLASTVVRFDYILVET